MEELTQGKIKDAITATWNKMDQAVQRTLDKLLAGEVEMTASTAAAITKFIEVSQEIAADPNLRVVSYELPPGVVLPTFDDSDKDYLINKPAPKGRGKGKK